MKRPRAAARLAVLVLVSAVLAAVFRAYLDPHAMVDLAGRIWACF